MEESDPILHLEQKRQEIAAMQQAAGVAQEQASLMLRLKQRVSEIDALAAGDNYSTALPTSLTAFRTKVSSPSTVSAISVTPAHHGGTNGHSNNFMSPARSPQHGSTNDATPWMTPAASPVRVTSANGHNSYASPARSYGGIPQDLSSTITSSPMRVEPRTPERSVASLMAYSVSPIPTVCQAASSLSAEDRFRFGLDIAASEEVPCSPQDVSKNASEREMPVGKTSSSSSSPLKWHSLSPGNRHKMTLRQASYQPPSWSTLSPQDRQRFGLEDSAEDHEVSLVQALAAAEKAPVCEPSDDFVPSMASTNEQLNKIGEQLSVAELRCSFENAPDILWGGPVAETPVPTMTTTLSALDAVTADPDALELASVRHLDELRASELKLQELKKAPTCI